MKKCPKCGKKNFSNVSFCSECNEGLADVPDLVDAQPVPPAGMHWFPAFLIMAGIRWVGGMIIGAMLAGSSAFTAGFIGELFISYIGLYAWLRLTGERYFRSGAWVFFTYLWYILNPISLAGNYAFYAVSYSYGGSGNSGFISILGIAASILGAVYVSYYRKRMRETA